MTTFYLIRHGENDLVGHAIAGRRPGIHLNERGRKQALGLAEHLASFPIRHIVSSPLERSRETAEPLAHRLGLEIQTSPALLEINFGEWMGKEFAELEGREDWRRWNSFRSGNRTPAGESMLDVQNRVVGELDRLRGQYRDEHIAVFSHGDPIRSAVMFYLGMPLDLLQRIEISTASISILTIDDSTVRVLCLNVTLPPQLS